MNLSAVNQPPAMNLNLSMPGESDLPDQVRPTRLLLVDDEPRLLSSLCEFLKDGGYELHTATCGAEAVAQLEKVKFDLALLDLRLPDFGGHEIMDFIKSKNMNTHVIILSGET